MLRSEADALDAVQNLFVQLIEQRVENPDLPLLYRMLTHRCLNTLRDEKNRARLVARENARIAPACRVAPDLSVLTLDLLLKLSRAVDSEVMETFVYRHLDDMGQEEIAALMTVSRKTVQNRLARAAEALATLKGCEVSP